MNLVEVIFSKRVYTFLKNIYFAGLVEGGGELKFEPRPQRENPKKYPRK